MVIILVFFSEFYLMIQYIMATTDINLKQILSNKYYCEKCAYETNRKNNMTTHLSSAKHQKLTTFNIKTSNNNNQPAILSKYCCPNCDKQYNDRAGLWRHKKNVLI